MFYYDLRGYSYFKIVTVSIDQWCAGISLFYGKVCVSIKVFNTNICLSLVCQNLFSLVDCFYLFLFCFYCVMEMLNPIQKPKKNREFSLACFQWQVNSLLAYDWAKVTSSPEGYNSLFKYGFICISETYLYSTNSFDKNNLNIFKV